MNITIKLFAAARSFAGRDEVTVDLPPGATAGDVRQALVAAVPALAQLAAASRIAVDAQYVADDQVVAADAEVACIPPVSGG